MGRIKKLEEEFVGNEMEEEEDSLEGKREKREERESGREIKEE